MKTLLLMRHAKSSWAEDGLSDHDRPLNTRGARTAPQMAAELQKAKLQPDLILSSTAERARETAFAVARLYEWSPELTLSRRLYLADPNTILGRIAEVADGVRCLLVVGHNPGMEELVSDLALQREHMPTAAIARFTFELDAWAHVAQTRPRFEQVWRPKEID